MQDKEMSESSKLTQTNISYSSSLIDNTKDKFERQTENSNNKALNSKSDVTECETSAPSSKLSRRDKIDLCLHTISQVISFSALFSFNPIFPTEAESKEVNSFLINLIFGINYISVLLSSPIFGHSLPTLGPNLVMSSSLLAMGSVIILLGFMHHSPPGTYFVVVMVTCRAALGIFSSAYSTSNLACVINKYPKNKDIAIGCVRSGVTIGIMTGSLLGGVFYDLVGYQFPFYFLGVATIIVGIINLKFVIKVTIPQNHPRSLKETMHSISHLLRSPLVSIAFTAAIIRSSSTANLISTLTFHMLPLGVSVSTIGLTFTAVNISELLANVLGSYLCSRFQERSWIISLGHSIFILAFVLLSPSFFFPFMEINLWTILTALLFFGVACGMTIVPCLRMVLQGAEEVGFKDCIDMHSLVSGLQLFFVNIGRMVGQLGIAMFQASTGIDYGYHLFVLVHVMIVTAALILFVTRKNANMERLSSLSLSPSRSPFQR